MYTSSLVDRMDNVKSLNRKGFVDYTAQLRNTRRKSFVVNPFATNDTYCT